jgi:hypothetical protein
MVTTISTIPQHSSEEKLITLTGIKWQTFQAIMSDVGDGRAWRIAYAEGVKVNRSDKGLPCVCLGKW